MHDVVVGREDAEQRRARRRRAREPRQEGRACAQLRAAPAGDRPAPHHAGVRGGHGRAAADPGRASREVRERDQAAHRVTDEVDVGRARLASHVLDEPSEPRGALVDARVPRVVEPVERPEASPGEAPRHRPEVDAVLHVAVHEDDRRPLRASAQAAPHEVEEGEQRLRQQRRVDLAQRVPQGVAVRPRRRVRAHDHERDRDVDEDAEPDRGEDRAEHQGEDGQRGRRRVGRHGARAIVAAGRAPFVPLGSGRISTRPGTILPPVPGSRLPSLLARRGNEACRGTGRRPNGSAWAGSGRARGTPAIQDRTTENGGSSADGR